MRREYCQYCSIRGQHYLGKQLPDHDVDHGSEVVEVGGPEADVLEEAIHVGFEEVKENHLVDGRVEADQ